MIEEKGKQSHVSSKLNYAVCFALFLRKNRFCVTQGFFVEFGVNNTVLFCIFFSPWLVLTLVLDPLSSNEWLFYEIMWKCRPLFPLNKTKLSTHVTLLFSKVSSRIFRPEVVCHLWGCLRLWQLFKKNELLVV